MDDQNVPASVETTDPANTNAAAGDDRDVDPQFDRRPWGTFQVLDEGPTYKVKRLTVEPGQRLSYQFHHHRAEHWVIVTGTARVTLDDVDSQVPTGQTVEVTKGMKHRIANAGPEILTFIEVQTGHYFGEDDIVRLDDDYGRST